MFAPAAVLSCALSILGRSLNSLPPIEFVTDPPAGASAGVEAFVDRQFTTITIVTTSPLFQELLQTDLSTSGSDLFRKLASVVVHEEWHILNGRDERGAYEAQLMTLTLLGSGPGTPLYQMVHRSMLAALSPPSRARRASARQALRTFAP